MESSIDVKGGKPSSGTPKDKRRSENGAGGRRKPVATPKKPKGK